MLTFERRKRSFCFPEDWSSVAETDFVQCGHSYTAEQVTGNMDSRRQCIEAKGMKSCVGRRGPEIDC